MNQQNTINSPAPHATQVAWQGAYIRTGGNESRDWLWMRCYGARDICDIGFVDGCGGPLDAPSTLPAGSVNSVEWTNGRGASVARQSTVNREAV